MEWQKRTGKRSITNVSMKRAAKLIAQHLESPDEEKIQAALLGDLPLVEELEAQYLLMSRQEYE